ncbi:MAG: tyrosine-type recombinase/integrase [Brotaphodocola sp.]
MGDTKEMGHEITESTMEQFAEYLAEGEKAGSTIKKYVRDVRDFMEYLKGNPVTKKKIMEYRQYMEKKFQASTVNNKLSAVGSYLNCFDLKSMKVNLLKIQRKAFVDESAELKEREYRTLLEQASRMANARLYYIILAIANTGIRISELQFITAEAVEAGKAEISMKGKHRVIILQKKLARELKKYMESCGITSGSIFITRSGKPVDRSNVCHEMKKLAERAGVSLKKVHPHSLRHLFARKFYSLHKDIAHLADILGHSSIETTRIYVAVSAAQHERMLNRMNLLA